jgi:hypothetical protein
MRRSRLVPILLWTCGCATVGPPPVTPRGADGYVYEGGWGVQGFAVPEEAAQQAVIEALGDLQMRGIHRERSRDAVMVDAQAHDGRHARVAIHRGGSGVVVAARIGRTGDDALARAIMTRAGVRLGTRPAEAIPGEVPVEEPGAGAGFFSRDAVPDEVMLPEQSGSQYRDTPTP